MRFFIPLAALTLAGFVFPSTASASWTEGEATILTLNELMPRVGGALGGLARTNLPGDTPVLLPPDSDLGSPKSIQIALVQSGLALRPQAGGWSIVDASAKSEAERARARLLPVVPLAPRATEPGRIQTGGVVLFGEVVAPPYRVEVSNDAVEINSVAVFPVPGSSATPPEPTKPQVETHDRMDAAVTNYRRNVGSQGPINAKRMLIEELMQMPGVTGAEWTGDDEVRLTRPDGSGEILTFATTGRDADPPTEESLRVALETQAEILRNTLAENATLFCGATYLLGNPAPDAAALRARIEEILQSGDSNALKIARLQAYTGHRDAAADLLYARVR
jgi:hypothetical protein